MFLYDRSGNLVNVEQIFSFDIGPDPDNEGYYVVQGQDSSNVTQTAFTVDAPMTEAEATALMATIAGIVGTVSLGSP
jgi:hypothetical protein